MNGTIEELKILSGGKYEDNAPKRQPLVNKLKEEGWTEMKMNIPESNEGWRSGNGEGIWVLTKDPDTKDERYDVVLLNNSVYYFGIITWGDVVTAVNRGENRPVIDWDEDGEHPIVAWMEG